MVLFILTFAVLGLLLGFAAVYNTGPEEGQSNSTAAVGEENTTTAANVIGSSESNNSSVV
ncbi:hypothetical protein [Candidatus Nitrososphaera gargensis]|uniref:hypothetical protein n=1 Tax=Candidatus Nitrososphaera gargensis TaxID=497727 RepID=UPI0011E4FCB1|nr:hypothetical protein [Candidatus Nitrososphaera gargensis]